jgi:hypothetical protein
MSVTTITHPDGRTFKLGMKTPPAYHPHLRLREFLTLSTLPSPPETLDLTPKAMPSLDQIMLNDKLGCCEISWHFGHLRGVLTGNANALVVTSDAWIEKLYEVIGGYKPSDESTDNGCATQDVLAYMTKTGEAEGYVSVNAADEQELKIAIWLFGAASLGAALPDAWVKDMSNLHWGVAGPSDPNNGHMFGCPGKYDKSVIYTSTWGQIGDITPAAAAQYCTAQGGGECWGILDRLWFSRVTQMCPTGFDAEKLRVYLAAIKAE